MNLSSYILQNIRFINSLAIASSLVVHVEFHAKKLRKDEKTYFRLCVGCKSFLRNFQTSSNSCQYFGIEFILSNSTSHFLFTIFLITDRFSPLYQIHIIAADNVI